MIFTLSIVLSFIKQFSYQYNKINIFPCIVFAATFIVPIKHVKVILS